MLGRERIRWEDDEWDRLAEIVFPMRLNDPASPLISLAQKAMNSFPQNRRRNLQGNQQIGPLIDRLRNMYGRAKEQVREVESLKARLAAVQTAEEILDSLSDTELVRKFGQRFLQIMTPEELLSGVAPRQIFESVPVSEILAEGVRRFTDELLNAPLIRQISIGNKPHDAHVPPTKTRLPKVVIAGMKSEQFRIVADNIQHVADVHYVDKNLRANEIPPGADLYVVWSRFTRHDVTHLCKQLAPPNGFIQHVGGIEKLIETIQVRILEKYGG